MPPGTQDAIAVDPTGRFAYIVDFNNSILYEFTVDATTGVLTRFAAPTLPHTLPTTQTTVQFAIDPQGKFAYTTDSNNGQIIIFSIDARFRYRYEFTPEADPGDGKPQRVVIRAFGDTDGDGRFLDIQHVWEKGFLVSVTEQDD